MSGPNANDLWKAKLAQNAVRDLGEIDAPRRDLSDIDPRSMLPVTGPVVPSAPVIRAIPPLPVPAAAPVRDLGELGPAPNPQVGNIDWLGTRRGPDRSPEAVARALAEREAGPKPVVREGGHGLGALPPVTPADVAKWEAKVTAKSQPPIPEISPDQLKSQEKAAAALPPPTNLGNKYGGGSGQPGTGTDASQDINWNRGGGGTATIAAHEVPVVAPKRQDELTAAMDKESAAIEGEKKAATGSAEAQAEAKRQEAIGLHDIAKASEDAGVDTKLRAQAAKDESAAYLKHIDDFSKQVADDKINPNRMYENASVPTKITWTIASMFGSIGQSLGNLPTNKALDIIQGQAAADIAAQRAQHETNRERLGDMHSLYAHALRATNSAEEAERVATGYALEGAKHEANAITVNAQSDVARKRGEEFAAAIDERIAQLGEKKVKEGIAMNPYQQARTVSTGPDMKEVYKTARGFVDDQAKLGVVVTPDQAIRYAFKMHTGADPLRGAGGFAGGAKTEGGAGSLRETQTATDEFNKQMDALQNHAVITGSGLGTAVGAQLPQRLAPESNDAQQQLHAINTQMLQAIGKVAKDADGKPNKAMIEKIEQRFELHLSDKPEIKQQKLNGIRSTYNALARQQGAKAPEPNAGTAPTFKP